MDFVIIGLVTSIAVTGGIGYAIAQLWLREKAALRLWDAPEKPREHVATDEDYELWEGNKNLDLR